MWWMTTTPGWAPALSGRARYASIWSRWCPRIRTVSAKSASYAMVSLPRRRGLPGRGRVLPGELRRRAFELLLLPLEPSLPGPRALQVVADVDAQPAQPLRLQLDQVPVLEGAEAAVVGARRQDVARLQGMDGADPLDAPRDLVGHVAGVEVLLERLVHPEPDLQSVRVAHLVGGHQPGAHGREGVAGLRLVEGVAARREAAGRPVDEVHVPALVIHRLRRATRQGPLADDQRHLRLALEDRGGDVGEHHGVAVADDGVGGLVKGVDRRGSRPPCSSPPSRRCCTASAAAA